MRKMGDDREGKNDLASTYEGHAKERRPTHSTFWIVEVPVKCAFSENFRLRP